MWTPVQVFGLTLHFTPASAPGTGPGIAPGTDPGASCQLGVPVLYRMAPGGCGFGRGRVRVRGCGCGCRCRCRCWIWARLTPPTGPSGTHPPAAGSTDVQCLSKDGVSCMPALRCARQRRCLALHGALLLPAGPKWITCGESFRGSAAAGGANVTGYDDPRAWCHKARAAASESRPG
jgi:hypothetical protein